MNAKYRHVFDEIMINNRWRRKYYSRDCDWVIFGVSKKCFSPDVYNFTVHLFGIDIKIWFKTVKHV